DIYLVHPTPHKVRKAQRGFPLRLPGAPPLLGTNGLGTPRRNSAPRALRRERAFLATASLAQCSAPYLSIRSEPVHVGNEETPLSKVWRRPADLTRQTRGNPAND